MPLFEKEDRKTWLLGTGLYMAVVMIIALQPTDPDNTPVWHSFIYNMCHLPVFIILALLIMKILTLWGLKKMLVFWTILFGMSYGGLMEVLQNTIPGRMADGVDLLLDFSGIVLAFGINKRWKWI